MYGVLIAANVLLMKLVTPLPSVLDASDYTVVHKNYVIYII